MPTLSSSSEVFTEKALPSSLDHTKIKEKDDDEDTVVVEHFLLPEKLSDVDDDDGFGDGVKSPGTRSWKTLNFSVSSVSSPNSSPEQQSPSQHQHQQQLPQTKQSEQYQEGPNCQETDVKSSSSSNSNCSRGSGAAIISSPHSPPPLKKLASILPEIQISPVQRVLN